MTTAGDIVSRVISDLHGYGSTQDRVTALTAPIGATDLTFTVSATSGRAVGLNPGICQIDSELVFVADVDAQSNTATLASFGRGYLGTNAVAHSAGAPVISRPTWPRQDVFKAMNEVLGGLFPEIFAVGTDTSLVYDWTTNTFQSSGDVRWVIDLSYQFPPTPFWTRINRFEVDPYNQAIRIYDDRIPNGAALRLMYASDLDQFAAETDDFAVTGMPDSCVDLLRLGTEARLLVGLDVSRAQIRSVEQSDRARTVPPNTGINTNKTITLEFQQRLANEARSLRVQYPAKIVRQF